MNRIKIQDLLPSRTYVQLKKIGNVMAKGMDAKKNVKKKPALTPKEKKEKKKEKKS